jgi:hypothetical protein
MAPRTGFEPVTVGLEIRCSIQLSYRGNGAKLFVFVMADSKNKTDLQRVGECLYRSQKSKIYYAIIKRGGR